MALSLQSELQDPFRNPQGWTLGRNLGCLFIEGRLLWQQHLETSCCNNKCISKYSAKALIASHKSEITFWRQCKNSTNMNTSNTPFTQDNKQRCHEVQVVTSICPPVVVQRDNLVHGKLQGARSSSRVHHELLKTGKSGWCREAVSPGWGLTTAQTLPTSLWPSLQVTAGLAKLVVKLKRKLPSTLTIKSFKNTHQQLPSFSVPCAPK